MSREFRSTAPAPAPAASRNILDGPINPVKPLRLALATRRYPPLIGGAERMVGYLAEALAREGADVTVLTSWAPGLDLPVRETVAVASNSRGPRRDQPEEKGGRLEIVRLGASRIRFVGTWLYMRNLRRWFNRNPVDLAYVSMLKHDAYATIRAGAALGFPVVLRPEGAGETGDVAWQNRGNFGRRIGRTCRGADAFVAISKAVEKELETAWISGTMRGLDRPDPLEGSVDRPRVVPIPNGVPIPDAPWMARSDWRAAPQAVFVGRLAPEKGIDTLVRAWPIVLKIHPRARLTLLGEGPERPRLEELARSLGLKDSIDLPGAAEAEAVADRLRRSDLFVLPSREEGMSVALLEAMALGVPAVATSIPGNRRILADFKHGRLAPVDDPDRFAEAILAQWADFDRAFHMSRAARARVEREFSIAAVARKHLALFRRLIEERRGRAI